MIGVLRDAPLTCDTEHLPGCYNPGLDRTWCICGAQTWPGEVGTWHSAAIRTPETTIGPDWTIGAGAVGKPDSTRVLGFDVYFLPALKAAEAAA